MMLSQVKEGLLYDKAQKSYNRNKKYSAAVLAYL